MPVVGGHLVAPTLVTPTVLTDTVATSTTIWPPPLDETKDYIIVLPYYRSEQVWIKGGRNVKVVGGHISIGRNGAAAFQISGGAANSTVWVEGLLIDTSAGFEFDGFKTSATYKSPGDRNFEIKNCRVINLRGQSKGPYDGAGNAIDDFGNPSSSTHADCIQTSGGFGAVRFEYCTFMSRYAGLQLQREQAVSGPLYNITAATRTGQFGTITMNGTHGWNIGDWVEINATNPTRWGGTYQITALPSATKVTVGYGAMAVVPGTWVSGGTVQFSAFTYPSGDVWVQHVNHIALPNLQQYATQQPASCIQGFRVGARPDTKTYEDETPLCVDGWTGTAYISDYWMNPWPGGTSFLNLVNPTAGGNTYPPAVAVATGAAPNRVLSFPSWPAVTADIHEGIPPDGNFCPAGFAGLNYPRVRA